MPVIKKLYFTTGVDVTAPTDLTAESSTTRVGEYADDTAFVTANGAAQAGDLYVNSTIRALRLYSGASWRTVVMSTDAADPTKTFLIDSTAATTATSATLAFAQTVSRTYTFQDETGTIPVLPIDLATETTNQLPIANGGTGQSTAAGAINALVPSQGAHVGKFLRTDGSVVSWDNAGGGSSSGNLNVIINPNDAAAGWTASGAGITAATTLASSEIPLEGVITSAIKITPVSGTDFVYYRFTMPAAFKNSSIGLSFYQRALAGYTTGDLKVDLYTNTLSNYLGTYVRVGLASDVALVTDIVNTSAEFATTFASGALDYYEFRITRVAGTSPITITNVNIGDRGVQGDLDVAYGSYTPVGSNDVNLTSYTIQAPWQWMRIGNVVTVSGRVDMAPTSGAAVDTQLQISLPIMTTVFTSSAYGAGGSFGGYQQGVGMGIFPVGATARVLLNYQSDSTTNGSYGGSFTYTIE